MQAKGRKRRTRTNETLKSSTGSRARARGVTGMTLRSVMALSIPARGFPPAAAAARERECRECAPRVLYIYTVKCSANLPS